MISVLIPAYMEADRVGETVRAAVALPGVTRVLVVDDGSTDETAAVAEAAGAEVLRQPINAGKGAAMRAGLAALDSAPDGIILLLDADVGASAAEAAKLLAPVVAGEADLAIARFPRPAGKAGFGLVKGLARWGTWWLTGVRLEAPISGQRACRRWTLDAAPIADGYGAEVAMNVAAGDARARIVEVPVEMSHNASGRDLAGFRHRGKQFREILPALLAAAVGRTGVGLPKTVNTGRFLLWALAFCTALFFALSWWAGYLVHPAVTLVAVLLVLALFAGPAKAAALSGLLRARRKNFQGRFIPALGGTTLLPLLVILGGVLLFPGNPWVRERGAAHLPWPPLAFLAGWMLLGMLDDLWGNAERKGFRGHLQALARGKLTTGGMKLLGGGLLALVMAWFLPQPAGLRWLAVPLAALLIALSANAMNLFDLRPGRALKIFWAAALPLLAVGYGTLFAVSSSWDVREIGEPWSFLPLLTLVLTATLLYAPFDFAGMMMLGDTGANPLGALLGYCLVLALPLPGQAVVVVVLIALHLYAEKFSITKTIERVPMLRWVDRLGR